MPKKKPTQSELKPLNMTDEAILERDFNLRQNVINNPFFLALIDQVELDIINKLRLSAEEAQEAHYMIKALDSVKGMLVSTEVAAEAIRRKEQELETDGYSV